MPDTLTFTGISGTQYTIDCFGTNAICRVEEALAPRSVDDIMAELRGPAPHVRTVREWFKASLVEPKGETLSAEQVGEIIDDVGGWTVVLVALDSQSPIARAMQFALAAGAIQIQTENPAAATDSTEPVTH